MSRKQEILRSEVILEKYGTSLQGKTILVTGVAEDSIGGELAIQLASASPAELVLTARAEPKVVPITNKIKAAYPDVVVRFLKIDLGSFASVREAAESLRDLPKLDSFVACAGRMGGPYDLLDNGIESQFIVNYLANFLLVKLLLPKIEAAGPSSSIVIMASSAVRRGVVCFDDINYSGGKAYDGLSAYGQSNAARVMFVKSLAEKLHGRKIRVFSIDPGAVRSGLQRHQSPEFAAQITAQREANIELTDLDGKNFKLPQWTSASEGAATIITAMIDPTIEEFNGAFLHNNAVAEDELHSHIRDPENRNRLWELSEKLAEEEFRP